MGKAKNRRRAESGQPFRNVASPRMMWTYVCANCHQPLNRMGDVMVKEGKFYFHKDCPKVMIPFTDAEKQHRTNL